MSSIPRVFEEMYYFTGTVCTVFLLFLQHDNFVGDIPHKSDLVQQFINRHKYSHPLGQAVLLHQPEIREKPGKRLAVFDTQLNFA